MTPSIITTYDICEYFQKGDIAILPDDHIKLILHKFFTRLQRGLSDEETKQKRIDCIKKYINNHALMAERYIKIINKQRDNTKHFKLIESEQNKKQFENKQKIYRRERYMKTKDLDNNELDKINKYYKSLVCYYVEFIEYDNEKLYVYCNIPLKHRHHTLKSFNNTESDKYNEYYFRNDKALILPEKELIYLLYTKLDIYKLD
jgi:NAD+--asparagine ADP-ribosyltransferase